MMRTSTTGRGVLRAATAILVAASVTTAASAAPRKPGEQEGIGAAISQPLRDLSIMREKTDEVLKTARAAPYADPTERQCEAIAADITALDEALGPDVDVAVDDNGNPIMALAAGAVKGAVGLPFRGVVRRLTGAEKRDRELQRAVLAGMARRSYLKGLKAGIDCEDMAVVLEAPAAAVLEARP